MVLSHLAYSAEPAAIVELHFKLDTFVKNSLFRCLGVGGGRGGEREGLVRNTTAPRILDKGIILTVQQNY